MTETSSALHHQLDQLSGPLRELLSKSNYTTPESDNVSIKSLLESLLKRTVSDSNPEIAEHDDIRARIRDFSLCCALLSSSASSTSAHISWVPKKLSTAADLAFRGLSEAVYRSSEWEQSKKIGQFGIDLSSVVEEKRLVIELMPEVLPLIKDKIKESSIDVSDDTDEISAASARTPVAYAIVAAYQLRWFVTQVEYPHLGKLCASLIPCGLTALDHWSPEVKGQGMISFIHVSRNVNAAEIGGYVDVILDACCHNIVSSDEIWHLAVEMFERMINEMLGHLERHPRDKERRIAWLNVIEPLFYSVGLVLLAHFRRLFPLFLLWVHADDDETVVLVLKRIHTVVQLTWIRNSPYVERLVDELAVTYKEAAVRTAREEIRMHIHQIMILLQQCKGLQFEAAWEKYKDDPNLGALGQATSKANDATVAQ